MRVRARARACVGVLPPGQAPEIALQSRGEIDVKGKGRMVTYWVGRPDAPDTALAAASVCV